MDFLLDEILEKLTPQFGVLVDGRTESVAEIAENNAYFLEIRLIGGAAPIGVGSIQEGFVADTQAIDGLTKLTIRTSIRNGLFQRINFGNLFADRIVYYVETDLSLNDEAAVGAEIGWVPKDTAGHDVLRVQFFNTDGDSLRPSFLLRTLALLNGYYQDLVAKAFDSHADTAFFLADYIVFLQATESKQRLYRLLRRSLRDEYKAYQKKFGASADPVLLAEYEKILPQPVESHTSAAIAGTYADAVDNSPDKRVYFFLEDLSVHFSAMSAAEYAIDIHEITDSDEFTGLVEDTLFQVAVNSPIYSIGICENASGLSRGWQYAKAIVNDILPNKFEAKTMVKGQYKARGASMTIGDCMPTVDRFYFAQKKDGNFVFDYQSMKDLPAMEVDSFDFAVEHLVGIFKDGLRVGAGHEIFNEPNKTEPDVLYSLDTTDNIVAQHGRARMGIPIVATTEVNGRHYFVLLVKPDERRLTYQYEKRIFEDSGTPEKVAAYLADTYEDLGPYADQWEPIVDFLRDLGVVHAFALDGDDSAGLIYKDEGEDPDSFLKVEPGLKKDGSMPFAVAFTKRDADLYPTLLNLLKAGRLYREDFLALVEKSGITAAQQLELISKTNNRILLPFDAEYISSPYGPRTPPVHGASSFHLGVDFGVPKGSPVTCIKDGTVHLIYTSPSYGLAVILYHGADTYGDKYYSFYTHLDAAAAQTGDALAVGDIFAVSGNSGALREGELLGFDVRVTPADYVLEAEDDYLTFFRNRFFSRDPEQFLWPDLSQL
jgi:murein DD-endopeptidase MepM/ murein hydrolase activator NlpD